MQLLTSVLILGLAASVHAASDFERFGKQVGKYATQLGREPRGLCLCRDPQLKHSVGYLLRGASEPIEGSSFVTAAMFCFVPGFDETTSEQGTTFICDDFVPIAR